MKKTPWYRELGKRIHAISENPILTAVLVLIILGIFILALSFGYYQQNFYSFWGQILAEAHGMLFDIAVIGILLVWLNKTGERRQRIRAYKDEIDDFRMWESEEAAFRTVGNIKRLNRHRVYNIDLSHCHLVKINLNYVKLMGANLNYANLFNSFLIDVDLEEARLNQTNFENCNMNQSSLSKSYANGAIFKDTYLIKANFEGAYLIKANFMNSFLMEADLRGATLSEADFNNANLYKADLRGAKGLTIDQLSKAKTLYLAKFDEDIQNQMKTGHPELVGQ
jgi:hypothetical protein